MYRRHPRGDARCTAHDAALPRRSRRPTRRRHGRNLPAGRRRRSVRPSFTDLKKRDGSMTDIATLSDLERLVEERAIERVLSDRSEEHTSELQSLMRISYADFCLQKKTPLN